MSEKVTFKYFEGQDAEQFSFYRIPKQLFTVSYFKGLSSDAKILYGLMLDRISLSVKNHWFDEEDRAYIYFSIDDVMELLGCGKNKAIKCMKELDVETGIGLTQKRRQGFGKTNMIYVKTFLVESQAAEQTSVTEQEADSSGKNKADSDIPVEKNCHIEAEKKGNSTDSGTDSLEMRDSDHMPEAEKVLEKSQKQTNEDSRPDTEVYNVNFLKFHNQTSRSPENKPQEVYISNPNNTEYNKTEYSDLKSYRILSGDTMSTGAKDNDEIRFDHRHTGDSREVTATIGYEAKEIYDLVRENINLDDLLMAREDDRDLILEIFSLIVEMIFCRGEEIVIASNRYPAEIVRSRFLKLRYDHIVYVMDCLEKSTNKVKNIRKYLLAALFNAPVTIDSYYRAEVRHDMPLIAQGLL